MVRGEKPIELGDSWFSTKSIEVERYFKKKGVEHSMEEGGPKLYRSQGNSEYLFLKIADRLWALRSKVEREKAPIVR